jgi:glycosyltransferase involved in cell wall biosynthesis
VSERSPIASVVVPVRDRLELLRLLLDALQKQSSKDFELVLVDDGSVGDVDSTVVSRELDFPVRVVRTEGVGAVEARRVGVAAARGEVLAFTDSDCEPDADWIAAGRAAVEAGADVVQGVTVPARHAGLLERTLSYRGGEGLFATCNVFYRRSAFDAAGGFDPTAGGRWRFRADDHARRLGFGEDSLLGWRVARNGTVAIAARAVVRHAVVRPPLREHFSRAWQVGAFPALVHEIPELRSSLLRSRVFLQSRSRVPLYLCMAASLAGRVDIAAIAAGWWTITSGMKVVRHWDEPVHKRLLALPVELALDATRAIALVVGSIRTRTPVL